MRLHTALRPLPLSAVLAILAVCFASHVFADDDMETLRLGLHWRPQAQFAGFYTALDKGFYADNNIALEIIPGGPDTVPAALLESGKVDFATMFLQAGIKHRSKGVPLVNIAQIVQRSALMIVARKADGVETLADLDGGRLGSWGGDLNILPETLLKRQQVNMEVIRQSPTLELFMRGGVDATAAMWYNEYHTLLGYGLTEDAMAPFFFSELGLDIPEDGIYCMTSTWEERPETARRFVDATIRGWEYAFEHPEEALDIVIRHMKAKKVSANKAHQRWMLSKMEEIILPQGREAVDVSLERKDFQTILDIMIEIGMIWYPVNFELFCKGPAS